MTCMAFHRRRQHVLMNMAKLFILAYALLVGCYATSSVAATTSEARTSRCTLGQLPDNTRFIALGAYEAVGRQHGFGKQRKAGKVKISGHPSGEPIVLVLSAYEPIDWSVSKSIADRVQGVIVLAYYPQTVAGLTLGTPVLRSNHTEKRQDCGSYLSAHNGGPRLDRVFNRIFDHFGEPIDKFFGRYKASEFNVDQPRPRWSLPEGRIDVPFPPTGGKVKREDVPEGKQGLQYLIKLGHIRKATKRDIALWKKAATINSPSGWLAPYDQSYPQPYSTYVILNKTVIPDGMFGGDSASFIIPYVVSEPDYTSSHNGYYFERDGRCSGTCPAHGR